MRTATLVVALTASGALGGVAGALLVQGLEGPAAPAPRGASPASAERDPSIDRELASLRARIDEMQSSVSASSAEAAQVRRDLDAERKSAAEARERLTAVETAAAAAPRVPDVRAFRGPGELALAGPDGAFLVGAKEDPAFAERMKKTRELRQKSEEDRWAAARDALGLSSGQEEELKAAIKERRQAMQDALQVQAAEGAGTDGSPAITMRMPDAGKVMEAKKKYDDRIASTLSADQSKKWRDDGYESALGGGNRGFAVTTIQADVVAEPR